MDTFVIKIKGISNFKINRSDLFIPEFKERAFDELTDTERKRKKVPHLQKFILHSDESDNKTSKVKIEIYEYADLEKRSVDYDMRIEANATKIAFSNNLVELSDNYGPAIKKILTDRLAADGITFPKYKDVFEKALVNAVHFGKNMLLEGLSVSEIVDELSKLEITQCEDITKKEYRNGSETLQFFSGVREYAFYDKIKDMQKTLNKRIDKSPKMEQEQSIVEIYKLKHREFLRFEYRLKNYQTIQSEINRVLGRPHDTHTEFSTLFSRDLQKKMLNNAWHKLIKRKSNQLALIGLGNEELKIFQHILRNAIVRKKDQHSQNKAFTSFGLIMAFKKLGVRLTRDESRKIWSAKTDERLETKIQEALRLAEGLPTSDKIAYITDKLEKFEQIDQEYLIKLGESYKQSYA